MQETSAPFASRWIMRFLSTVQRSPSGERVTRMLKEGGKAGEKKNGPLGELNPRPPPYFT
jgi:hypothetical protein